MANPEYDNYTPFLTANEVSIAFGPTQALDRMSFEINEGEIIGLIGANGAGKSTLVKVITGVYKQNKGELIYRDAAITPETAYDARDARARGIYCAYQELPCCTNLKVYENFLISHMSHRPFDQPGWRKRAKKETAEILETVFPGSHVPIHSIMDTLPMMQRQMVEICKAISQPDLKVLILDEPTSYLPTERIEQLHAYLKILQQKKISVIYISHKLDEIEHICTRVTIMRNGRKECDRKIEEITKDEIISLLGGKEAAGETLADASSGMRGKELFSVENLNKGILHNINMQLFEGEIVGISGLDGGGQSELMQTLYDQINRGKVRSAEKLHASYVSGNRAAEGVFPLWSISQNINISSLDQISRNGYVNPGKAGVFAQKWFEKFEIKAPSAGSDITSLSGGNQQKVLIARGLASNADVILLNDPTCGVDISTKQDIYEFMQESKKIGKSVILFSTEDMEMCQCDRVYIMHEGTIVEELSGRDLNEKNIVETAFKWKSGGEEKGSEDIREKNGVMAKILDTRALIAVSTFIVLYALIASLKPVALTYKGFNLLFAAVIPFVMAGLGQMFVSIGGGIDMGIGMAIAFANVEMAVIGPSDIPSSLLICTGIILVYGLIGLFIYRTRIPAVIVTLGMSFIWKGLCLIVSPTPRGKCPDWLKAVYKIRLFGLTGTIIFPVLALAIAFWIVKISKYGIIMNGVGNNSTMTERSGWSTPLAIFCSYAIAGAFVVLAGISLTAITGSGDYTIGNNYPLMSIAIFVLGGCDFIGAFSSPTGVVMAAFAMTSITTLLTFARINTNYTMMFTGFVLILSMVIKRFLNYVRRRA